MKRICFAFLAFLGITLMFACKKEKSFEGGFTGNLNAEWEFKEGKHYKGKVDTAYIEDFGVGIQALFLEGTSSDGKAILSIQVINIDLTKPATYKTPNVLFTYLNNTSIIYANDILAANEFELVVKRIDSVSISAIFYGKVKDSTGTLKTVTEGKFSAKLKKVVVPPPVGTGTATFWAKTSCASGGNVIIKLNNNQTGVITSFTPTEPASCGVNGTATFTLPPGNYTWKAYCGSQDSTSGTITVVANQCVKTNCSFAAGTTDCKLSTIGYYFMPGMMRDGAINTFWSGNQVSSIQVYDSATSTINGDFPATYGAGQIKFGSNIIFTLNPNGTVSQYSGTVIPFDNSSVIVKYEYNSGGYMTTRTVYLNTNPTTPALISIYTWTGGNLTRIVNTLSLTNERWETDFQYNNATTVKSFLNFQYLAYELIQFHTAINTGKQSTNVPVTTTTKYYDNNVLKSTDVSNFINYVIDANSYVKSFEITGNDFEPYLYNTNQKYVLNYKCF